MLKEEIMKQETILLEKKINSKGYVLIKVNNSWVLEHQYIVECQIGRELTKEEVVHHISGNRKDNRIINLMFFPNQKEHQKFHLKIKQFGYTRPILRQIEHRWDKLIKEDIEVIN